MNKKSSLSCPKFAKPIRRLTTFGLVYGVFLSLSGCVTKLTEAQNDFDSNDIFQTEYAEVVTAIQEKYFLKINFDRDNFHDVIGSLLHALDPKHIILQQADVDRLLIQYTGNDLTKEGYKKLNDVIDEFLILEHAVLNNQILVYLKELEIRETDLIRDASNGEFFPADTWVGSEAERIAKLNSYVANDVIYYQQQGYEREAIAEQLNAYYSRLFGNSLHLSSRKRFEFVVNALMTLLDSDSNYFLNVENPGTFTLTGNLEGIGLAISEDFGAIKVEKILPGGPADTFDTIYEGDRIVGISQGGRNFVPTFTMTYNDAVKLLRGEKDTNVHLQIRRENNLVTTAIPRGPVKLEEKVVESELKSLVVDGKTIRLGIITVPSFYIDFQAYSIRDPNYKSSSRDVKLAIANLRNDDAEAIILDLRNNGGGALSEGRAMSALFIEAGPVMQLLQGRAGKVFRDEVRDSGYVYKGPLVILVNQQSAGSSEIVAGTVQDYGVGVVVGQQTFGHGIVQSLAPTSLGMIKLTENEIYRVTGTSYQIHGVQADIELKVEDSQTLDSSDQDARQRDKPYTVQPGKIDAANFTAYNRVTIEQIETLRRDSLERVTVNSADKNPQQDQDFDDQELNEALRIAIDLIQMKP